MPGVLGVAGIQEHAPAHQDAVGLGHQTCDPAHVEVLAPRSGPPGQALVHKTLHGRFPEAAVRGVDGELVGVLRHAHVRMGDLELAEIRVQRAADHAVADGQHQHRAGTVDGIAGGDLGAPGLEEILRDNVPAGLDHVVRGAQHREDTAHRDVDVDVAGTVQRDRSAADICRADGRAGSGRALHLLGGDAGELARPFGLADQHLVADQIQRLLLLAMDVDRSDVRRIRQPPKATCRAMALTAIDTSRISALKSPLAAGIGAAARSGTGSGSGVLRVAWLAAPGQSLFWNTRLASRSSGAIELRSSLVSSRSRSAYSLEA